MKSPPPRLLDLDDLRALLAEQPRAERRGDARAEIDDADTVERSSHGGSAIVAVMASAYRTARARRITAFARRPQ